MRVTRRRDGRALVVAVALMLGACGGTDDGGNARPGDRAGEDGAEKPGSATGPGISIEEALRSTGPGPLLVNGLVVAPEGQPVRLCSALDESPVPEPPGCGEPFLVVEELEVDSVAGLETTGTPPTRWTPEPVQLLGDVAGGVLTVAQNARS
jgi:hypothetical protein